MTIIGLAGETLVASVVIGYVYSVFNSLSYADAVTYITIAGMFFGAVFGLVKHFRPQIAPEDISTLKKELESKMMGIEEKANHKFAEADTQFYAVRTRIDQLENRLLRNEDKTTHLEEHVDDLEEELQNVLGRIENKIDHNHDRVIGLLMQKNGGGNATA